MAKYTIQLTPQQEEVLESLAAKEGISKAQVIRKSLALLKLAEERKDDGYALTLTKAGEPVKEILLAG